MGYTLSSLEESDIQIKTQNYDRALRIINQVFKTIEVQNHTRMEAYEVLARSAKFGPSESRTNGAINQLK